MPRVSLFLLCAVPVLAQQAAPGASKQSPKSQPPSTQASAGSTKAITVDSIVDMVQAGLSDDLIITSLRKESRAFDLSPADMIRLKKANVSESVMKVMLDPKAEVRSSAPTPVASTPPPAPTAPRPPTVAPVPSAAIVQVAVNQLVDWTRKGGSITVRGVQEFPAQNEARADLQFNDFQYNANGFTNIPKQKNEVTPPEPNPNSPNFYSEMASIPARERHVARYSGNGIATIKHYSDGRWVLTQVDFNFLQITGNILISSVQPQRPPATLATTTDVGPPDGGVAPAQRGVPASPAASAPPVSLVGKWRGQIVDAQGAHTVTLILTESGSGSGAIVTAPVRGSSKTFDLVARFQARGTSVLGTLDYKYKMLLVPCNATITVSAQLDGGERWSGSYTSKSTCSNTTENGTISVQRN